MVSAKWQATAWPDASVASSGRVVRHGLWAYGQRGWKAQPEGGADGEGGSPTNRMRGARAACAWGTAEINARV